MRATSSTPRGSTRLTRPACTCPVTTGRSGRASSRAPTSAIQARSSRSAPESTGESTSSAKPCSRRHAARPPACASRSSRVTAKPRRASPVAAASPASPDPTTTTRRSPPLTPPTLAHASDVEQALEAGDHVEQGVEALEGEAAALELGGERVLGEGDVGGERAAEVGDAAVPDVHQRRAGRGLAEGVDPPALAGARAAAAGRVRVRGRDAPDARFVAQVVRVVGEADRVEQLEAVQVPVEAVGEHAKGDALRLAPRDER